MKQHIGVLVGGRSTEHDASLLSYVAVLRDLNARTDHEIEVTAVYFVSRQGRCFIYYQAPWPITEDELNAGDAVSLGAFIDRLNEDKVFLLNLLHGTEGEDGSWQGLADIADLKGSFGSVFGSNITMNKWAQSVLAAALCGPRLRFPQTWRITQFSTAADFDQVIHELGTRSCVVKPNRMGASLLTERYDSLTGDALRSLVNEIAPYDSEVLVQEYIVGTEYTCGCLERDGDLIALPVIEALTERRFMGHDEKCRKGLVTPRVVVEDTEATAEIKRLSSQLFRSLDLIGMCRFDFLVTTDGTPYYLEANFIPGLMPDSAFPMMLSEAGLDRVSVIESYIQAEAARAKRNKILPYAIDLTGDPFAELRS